MVVQQQVFTLTAFEQVIADEANADRYELIHGTIAEKPMPTQEHGIITARLSFYMIAYLDEHPLGNFSVETAHTSPGDQYNKRIPDASYIRKEAGITKQGAVPRTPDIAVEILSPDQSPRELREKAHYYLSQQTQIVWIIFPRTQQVEVRTLDDVIILEANDVLRAGDVLPGFAVEVSNLFRGI